MESQPKQRLGQQIKETNAFSHTSLLLGVLSSVVSSAIIPALGAGRIATVAGAALSPLLMAVFTTRGAGIARTIGIVALSVVAFMISIGGFTLPEAIAGTGSLTASGSGTFVSTRRTPEPTTSPTQATEPTKPETTKPSTKTTGLKVDMPKSRKCPDVKVGDAEACKQIGVHNSGATTLEISTVGLEGDQAGDFSLTKQCNGTLKPNKGCSVRLEFRPTAVGVRKAVLVIQLNPGDVTRRVTITGEGIDDGEPSDGCRDGFVPRQATPDDSVCVLPEERAEARGQNQAHQAEERSNADGTCVDGFVWREAVPGDQICVTPDERAAAQSQNNLNSERSNN
jgi:hypothetical protein